MLFQPISERDSLCQGDILEVHEGTDLSHLGVVITADCDIAQSKFGRYLTYLPIVPVGTFLRDIWAPLKLRDQQIKAATLAVEMIWPIERLRDSQVDRMKEEELIDWLKQDEPENILTCFPAPPEKRKALLDLFVIITESTKPSEDNLQSLFKIWTLQRVSSAQQRSSIRSAITQIRSDFVFLPTMPEKSEIGYVALLRDVQSIDIKSTFRSYFEYASEVHQNRYAIRIGRFSDNLKYSITQKFSHLFSRIGLEEYFESECSASVDILLESLVVRNEANA